jgi:HAD superfamily hydrolase (TIGR01509 family)
MSKDSPNNHPYRAVILDVDGTLVDSNDAHVQVWVDALAEHGIDVPFEKIRKLVGMGGDNLLPAAVAIDKESPEGKAIADRRGELFRSRYLHHLEPFPAIRKLLERMKDAGLDLVVASSSPEDEMKVLLERAGVADLMRDTTSGSDAKNSKPDPDIVQAALKKIGLPPEETIMLGDTPYDIEAARKAGVGVIALRCGGFPDEDLKGAVALYDDAADLLANFDESPLGAAQSSRSTAQRS